MLTLDKNILNHLIESIQKNFPENYNFAPTLAKLLNIDYKTIYRKLNGESQFTLAEFLKLSETYKITLNELLPSTTGLTYPMTLQIHDFSTEANYKPSLNEEVQHYKRIVNDNNIEYLAANSTYPVITLFYCKHMAKFDYLKWLYFNKKDGGGQSSLPNLQELKVDVEFHANMHKHLSSFRKSVYILSTHMMANITEEILYFYHMRLLTEEDVLILKQECLSALDWFEECCRTERVENGNEILVYYSEMNLPTDLYILRSEKEEAARILTYFHNIISNNSLDSARVIKQWFDTYLRTATKISGSAELHRYKFFNKQREELEKKLSGI